MVGPKTSPGAASRAEPAPILWLSGGLFHSLFHLRLAPWSAGCGTCQKFQRNVTFRVWECFLLPDGARSRTPLPSLPSLQPAASAINLFFQKVKTLWEGQSSLTCLRTASIHGERGCHEFCRWWSFSAQAVPKICSKTT